MQDLIFALMVARKILDFPHKLEFMHKVDPSAFFWPRAVGTAISSCDVCNVEYPTDMHFKTTDDTYRHLCLSCKLRKSGLYADIDAGTIRQHGTKIHDSRRLEDPFGDIHFLKQEDHFATLYIEIAVDLYVKCFSHLHPNTPGDKAVQSMVMVLCKEGFANTKFLQGLQFYAESGNHVYMVQKCEKHYVDYRYPSKA